MLFPRGPPSTLSRILQLIVVAAIVSSVFHLTRQSQRNHLSPMTVDIEAPAAGQATPEEQYLARIAGLCHLSKETSWLALRVRSSEEFSDWRSMTDVPLNLQADAPKVIDIEQPVRDHVLSKRRLELPVPSSPLPGQVDASDLLFGVSTTYSRFKAQDTALLQSWVRWLTNGRQQTNGASLIVMLDQSSDEQVQEVDELLSAAGIDAYVTTTEEPMSLARRYYELTRILKTFSANLEANGQTKRWFGLVEDSVFFPSLGYLLERLYTYNTATKIYIGMPSERDDWENDDKDEETITTAGGGAVFLSRPALTFIPRLHCFGRDEGSGGPVHAKHWDALLQDCITKQTDWKMHVLPGFYSPNDATHNPDIHSYETGMQPLLLHRAEDRHSLDATRAHLVTDLCGELCFMQRFQFHDNFVLVNGVSITQYANGVEVAPRDESTTSPNTAPKYDVPERLTVIDNDGADKKVLTWKGRRKVWRLMDSTIDKTGAVWQAYVKKADTSASAAVTDTIDSAMILIWENDKPHLR
ncbi:hypothetical protein B0I35DRAFT_403673 [Stachybotrys elegans]|uniref:Glycosyltransferase family 31 protein n=1 Tax=Stachybotrys elegans TaxID=80388 RepID=A0A8K0WW40_9HYPO|nr:hypothetical protein B0I35DRAFT_403673 [Stachybotrys elegans]